ncbi:hypothetical protein EON63_14890 [archaeon]|nr:MAG: hypothetical protein EON63_14890 [archaeon]
MQVSVEVVHTHISMQDIHKYSYSVFSCARAYSPVFISTTHTHTYTNTHYYKLIIFLPYIFIPNPPHPRPPLRSLLQAARQRGCIASGRSGRQICSSLLAWMRASAPTCLREGWCLYPWSRASGCNMLLNGVCMVSCMVCVCVC